MLIQEISDNRTASVSADRGHEMELLVRGMNGLNATIVWP
jgi:hypothetical protein